MLYITRKLKNLFHFFEALFANIYYGFPSKRLKVIGVTGTDGKTTTTHLIYHILKTAGKKVSMISTIFAIIADKTYDIGLHTTTPSSFDLQKYLSLAVNYSDEFFVLETTSHAIDQNRIWGISYYISVLTNISHEHLDYHKNYENYLKTKTKLLLSSKIAIINRDDKLFDAVFRKIKNKKDKIITYGNKNEADVLWNNKISNSLLGDYNKDNILAAYAVCRNLNINEEIILQAVKTFKLPQGRFDIIYDKNFKIIIDFAHTPNAIYKLLKSIRLEMLKKKQARIIHIFGSAGLRDASKRLLMGEASAKYADLIILTEEDYRTESIEEICRQISQGLEKTGFRKISKDEILRRNNPMVVPARMYTIIINRFEAIKLGIILAQKGDIVVITGKGHEKSLCRGKTEFPWNEYKAVWEALSFKK